MEFKGKIEVLLPPIGKQGGHKCLTQFFVDGEPIRVTDFELVPDGSRMVLKLTIHPTGFFIRDMKESELVQEKEAVNEG